MSVLRLSLILLLPVITCLSACGGGGGGGTTFIEYDEMDTETIDQKSYASPNPFTKNATFSFYVNSQIQQQATISIFDSFGRIIFIAKEQINGIGEYSIQWNGNDVNGNPVPKGYYFYTIQFGNTSLTGKVIKI